MPNKTPIRPEALNQPESSQPVPDEPQFKRLAFTLNGKNVACVTDVRFSLLELLRREFHLTSVKKGCEVGECGACTVLIDGQTFDSCIYLAVWADGRTVTTLEGLMGPDGQLSDIQQAFIDETAVQCGFCTPGMIMAALPILDSGRAYTRDELRKLMAGNMCRCTGYENILNAVEKVMHQRLKRTNLSPAADNK